MTEEVGVPVSGRATVLVTGGTGSLGTALVPQLRTVRLLSRQPTQPTPEGVEWFTGDLCAGIGLERAVAGTAVVVHCATEVRAPRRDLMAAQHLLEVVGTAGRPHVVYMSIVGVDRVPLSYYKLKLEVEERVAVSGLPWTVLRATQFHGLVFRLLQLAARLPILPVPAATLVQPVSVRDVAERLTGLALSAPAGRAADFGGPEVLSFDALAATYLATFGHRRQILPLPLPGRIAASYREGGHLAPEHRDGRRTFAQFVAERAGLS